VNLDGAGRLVGALALMGAGMFASEATRMRRQGELLVASIPKPLDEALADVRRSRGAVTGVFHGRLGTEDDVTSPGGVVCAFYEAEIRRPARRGGRGPLLSIERGFSQTLWLRGEAGEARVAFSPRNAIGRREIHSSPRAVCFEKIGRKGEPCLVAGELRPGPVPGSFEIRGAGGGPATVILGEQRVSPAKRVLNLSWATWAVAAGLCAAAAMLLA
jgi:hypothetical protein